MTERQNPASTDEAESTVDANDEKMYTSEPIENEAGETYVIRQQNVGPGNEFGSGEWPDPHTPPSTDPKPPEKSP
jgi:hypothetical protein